MKNADLIFAFLRQNRLGLACASLLLLLILCPGPLPAQDNQTPIQIEADHMETDQKNNAVLFSGKVIAKQGDVVIHSERMTVYYAASAQPEGSAQTAANKSRDIERIYAEKNVEITQEDWVATGNVAEYFADERKVVITGDTKVWQDNNMVTGDRFVMYLDEGKTVVERAQKEGGRVKAFFYPDAEKQQ